MKTISFCFFALLAVTARGLGQDSTTQQAKQMNQDTTSLLYAFKTGGVHGSFRYVFMATDNAEGLTDYYANAIGGSILYETGRFKGFQLGLRSSFVYNIGSSDLTKPDPNTNAKNRYEIGLFDMLDPANKNNLYRLEELYLKYGWKKSHITFGKQSLNTPFINPQDGRVRPGYEEGLWAEINDIKNTKIETGFLYGMSPRSTIKWFKTAETFGISSSGVNPDGSKSAYAGNIQSAGIGILGVTHQSGKDLSLQLWDVWVQNVFNTAMLQADYHHTFANKSRLIAGVQYIFQHAINDGGNPDSSKTYFTKGGKANTFGARLGWENNHWQTSLNFNRITAAGRFLMPREWGREPFFTFIVRERNEGYGDVSAYTVKTAYNFTKAGLRTQLSLGYFHLPDVTNYRFNKYGLPSYKHLAVEAQYKFKGWLQGFDSQLIFAYKANSGNTYGNNKYVINKVNMANWAVIVNYHF